MGAFAVWPVSGACGFAGQHQTWSLRFHAFAAICHTERWLEAGFDCSSDAGLVELEVWCARPFEAWGDSKLAKAGSEFAEVAK